MTIRCTVFENRIISRNSDVNWPPRSCDLTPLDYFLWGALKDKYYATISRNQPPVKFKAERRFSGRCIGSRERGFLVLTGMPSLILGESSTASIKDFAICPPDKKKKKHPETIEALKHELEVDIH